MSTMAPEQAQAQAVTSIISAWLRNARPNYDTVQVGSVGTGLAGGPQSIVTWTRDLPEEPMWCTDLVIEFSLPITLTLPAGQAATLSPYAPFSAFQRQLLLGGAIALPYTSGVPYWLDLITSKEGWDPTTPSVPTAQIPSAWSDAGPANQTYGLGALVPGQTVNNAGTTQVANNYTLTWRERIRLGRALYGRRRPSLVGTVPLGDPDHRPVLNMYLNNLVGNDIVNNLFVNAGGGVTCVTNGQATVTACWVSRALDILPPGTPQIPAPRVMMGLSVVDSGALAIAAAGAQQPVKHRTAMLYTKIIHVLQNNQAALDSDYFGLWLTGAQQSARWEFDANLNNLHALYEDILFRYERFLPQGVFVADLIGGYIPELPKESPYDGVMSPDRTYAAQAGVAPTPSMQTVLRAPNGTTINNCTARAFAFGLVNVTY